ncbi:MAG: hypothetical protein NC833_02365 [Candidatus Omnitrophica bacterium]|nr:hypothetical protein [Candidatus Omnitrophota bacterium]
MKIYLYAGKMNENGLKDCLKKFDNFNYIIVEFYDSISFLKYDKKEISSWDFSKIKKGRAFGDNSELRWRRKGDEFILSFICEEQICIDFLKDKLEIECEKSSLNTILWGRYIHFSKNTFFEEKIPKIIEYPIDLDGRSLTLNKSFVSIEVVIYKDKGKQILNRLKKLEVKNA